MENYKIGFWKSSKVFSTKALLKNRPLTGLQKNYNFSYADFVFLLLTLAWLFGVYLFSPNTEPNKFGQGETQCSKA